MMSHTIATLLVARIGRAQQQVLRLTEGLPEAALRWQAGAPAPSMRFHLWHLARWADRVQASLPTLTPALQQRLPAADEIWVREGLAMGWGLTAGQLGEGDTGMGLDDDASAALPLPERDALVAYARRAFAATEQGLAAVETSDLLEPCTDLYGRASNVEEVLLTHLGHVNRHLGMIEALRGVYGTTGTATS